MADGKTRKTRTVKRRKTTAPTKDLPSVAAAPKKRGKVGRPTKMTEAVEKEIEAVCRLACRPSYNFIAEYIGVNTATFQNWLKAYKGLRENIDDWRWLLGPLEWPALSAKNRSLDRIR